MFFKTHKKILLSILAMLCLISAAFTGFFYSTMTAYGDVTCGNDKCYGGKITKVTYCTCYYDFGVMLEIEDKSNNNQHIKIFYSPYRSKLRAYYNIWQTGPQVLGAYIPDNHECKMTKSYYCNTEDTTKGTIDNIKGVGTTSR